MPRSSTKAAAGEPEEAAATVTINLDSFRRTRDSVVTGLAILQDAIQTMSSDYIKHTNAVLGEHGGTLDVETALSRLGVGDNPLLGGALGGLRTASPAKVMPADGKKERKKRTHDPNAPKRPLTPFFLYMQTARSIIADDLGPDAAKGAVSAEGTHRWASMAAGDKRLWNNAYNSNLRLYHARMHAYKNGDQEARNMTDEDALTYAEENNIDAPSAEAQLVKDAAMAAPAEEEEETAKAPSPPAKSTPKNKNSRAKKATKGSETAASPAIVPTPSTEKEKPGDKKRKRLSKKGKDAEEGAEKEDATPAKAAPKKPRSTKKAKTDA